MKVEYTKNFLKYYEVRIVRNKKLSKKFDDRVSRFLKNPSDSLLNDHSLGGDKFGLRAFWITGDIRIVYKQDSNDVVTFFDVGTHNQVY